jgi:CBS-domain-containing membrane protein
MRGHEMMSRQVVTARPSMPITEASVLLLERGVRTLPVVADDARLVGIVSGGDLLRGRVGIDPRAHARPLQFVEVDPPHTVSQVMTEEVISLPPNADQAEFAAAMLKHNVRSIPVVSEGRLVGIVTTTDLLRTQVRTDQEIRADVLRRLREDATTGSARWNVQVDDGVVTLSGDALEEERAIATVLAQTVPGTVRVQAGGAQPSAESDDSDEPGPPGRSFGLPLDHRGLRVLGLTECLDLLRHAPMGRVALVRNGEPIVVPVNYGIDNMGVVFRTTWGSKLVAAQQESLVAFEVDHADEERRGGWSVLVTGRASIVSDDEDVDRLERLGVPAWIDVDEDTLWVRITPNEISGRAIIDR